MNDWKDAWERKQQKLCERMDETEKKFGKIAENERRREENWEMRSQKLEESREKYQKETQPVEEMKKAKEETEARLHHLSKRWELQERKEIKNNVVIQGKKWKQEDGKESVKKFLKEEIGAKVEVKRAKIIGERRNMVIVVMDSWNDKSEVMEKKRRLGSKKIYTDNDSTKKEREIQRRLQKIAREEREKNKTVKIGHKRIMLEGKCLRWHEEKEELREEQNFREEKQTVKEGREARTE